MQNVKDSECVLFSFLNENDNEAKIGFRSFLDKILTDGEMSEHIDEEKVILVKWPVCEIGPASKMNSRLKTCTNFEFKIAKIIAFGGKYFIYFSSFNQL